MSAFLRTSSFIIISTCIVLTACGGHELGDTPNKEVIMPASSSAVSEASSISSESVSSRSGNRPNEIVLPVPFQPQAPLAVWDALHEEACEEMSMIMVAHALKNTDLSAQDAEKEVQALIAWEQQNHYNVDVTVDQVADIMQAYYDISGKADTNVTEEHIADLLIDGHLIIIPAAGRKLGNPYFSGEGPWYHMLVIRGWRKGYISNVFITNDPGTKRGASYEYDTTTVINAIHDWVGVNEKIETGPKVMFVVDAKNF